MDVKTLKASGFVSFEYPLGLRDAVHGAMASWKAFCTLPMEQKQLLSGGDRINDFGYMYRDDPERKSDHKEQFHALRANFPLLLPKAKLVGDDRATAFIEAIELLIIRMEPVVLEFAREVERVYKLNGFEYFVRKSLDYWTFRYLHYFAGWPILAAPHADRGGFTFHLDESDEGGEYYDLTDRQWRRWPVSAKRTIIFPSMGLQFISKCMLKALWHQVVCNKATIAAGRYSMVMFADFQYSHRFNDARFNMKDFSAGFNYDMSFEEFGGLFVPRKELIAG